MLRGALLLAVAASSLAATANAAIPACAKPEVRYHDRAVFGHFATQGAASAMKRRAAKLGFQGIKIVDKGCGDFQVMIDGADTQKQRSSFAGEASRAGFQVTFEQIAPPMAYQPGQVVGVFARKRTIGEANALMWRLASVGFRYIDVVPQGKVWAVVMPQVPVKHALSIAKEAASVGYRIQFRPGDK
jgi:hypothetical protein